MAKDTPQRIRGTQDIFGEDQRRFQHVVDTFESVRKAYAYQRVELPVFEATAVFSRSLGETTDVVSKEMYTFEDKSGDWVTLRPEFTAGIARAYITNGWQQFAPLKIATHGPVFRYERPQQGRHRQFHQLDLEIIGNANPRADVELLVVANSLLKKLKIRGVTLQLNTLGDAETRDAWRGALVSHFEKHRGDLSEDSLARLDKNPLRILDSKDPRDRAIADAAPDIDAYLSSAAGDFFENVIRGLDAAGVAWTRNSRLVRGLDYYRHTAFEFVTDRLGAQGTVLAGGRYDGLIGQLGGPETPGVGWAAGIERLAALLDEDLPPLRSAAVVLESELPELTDIAHELQSLIRASGMPAYLFADGAINKRFNKATKSEADYLVILLEGSTRQRPILRIKRQIKDRYRTRGTIYIALRRYLYNRFDVPSDRFKEATEMGGEMILSLPPL